MTKRQIVVNNIKVQRQRVADLHDRLQHVFLPGDKNKKGGFTPKNWQRAASLVRQLRKAQRDLKALEGGPLKRTFRTLAESISDLAESLHRAAKQMTENL